MCGGDFGEHFGQGKIYDVIEQKFFRPKIRKDVYKFVKRYQTYHESNRKSSENSLYSVASSCCYSRRSKHRLYGGATIGNGFHLCEG